MDSLAETDVCQHVLVSTGADDYAQDAVDAARIAASGRPSDEPIYWATPQEALARFFGKYAVFHGRASRSEFWWAYALNVVAFLVAGIAVEMSVALTGPSAATPAPASIVIGVVLAAYVLAALVPTIAVFVRRLHDANLSGWWFLLTLVPFAGPVIGVIFGILPRRGYGKRFDRG
jgi:uncharacterized membrane protein YhaH (DUF805 family)